jgi:hypothetical protein
MHMISRAFLMASAVILFASAAPGAQVPLSVSHMPNGAILASRIETGQQQHAKRVRLPQGTDFDNFDIKYSQAPYTPWNGYLLCGAGDAGDCGGAATEMAMAFTTLPTGSQYAKGLDVALSVVSGTGGATVAIYSDNGGAPGSALAGSSQHVTAVTPFGTLGPILQAVYQKHVALANSTQYWMVVTPDSGAALAWDIEDTDYTDSFLAAAQAGSGAWEPSSLSAYVPAFDIVK